MNAIVKPENQDVVVFNALQSAIEKGADPDTLEKILNMQERVLDRQSEQAYAQSMVEVQMKMPAIIKNKTNDQTRSSYSDMGQILKQITPFYTAAGFALSFGNGNASEPNEVRVTCDVMHSQGHSKPYFIDVPIDMTGIKGNQNKTAVHGTGSAISYGQRYLIKLIFNLNTSDDDDGNAAGGDTRSVMEVEQYWFKHIEALRELIPSIHAIKTGIATGNLEGAIEAWRELSEDEHKELWFPAPSKGGILTTQERTVIKSDEWGEVGRGL